MTPGSSIPYMSTSQEVKSPFLPDLKPSVSNLHSSPPGELRSALRTGGQGALESPPGNLRGEGKASPLFSVNGTLCKSI